VEVPEAGGEGGSLRFAEVVEVRRESSTREGSRGGLVEEEAVEVEEAPK